MQNVRKAALAALPGETSRTLKKHTESNSRMPKPLKVIGKELKKITNEIIKIE